MSGIALVVDTNIFNSARNRGESGWTACRTFLGGLDRGEIFGIVSTLTLAELRAGFADRELPTVWRSLLSHLPTSRNYRVEPFTPAIAERAGEIRARDRLTLADAVIIATGLELGADGLVTQDLTLVKKQSLLPTRLPSEGK